MFEKSGKHLEPIWQKKLDPDFLATGLPRRQPQQIINGFVSNQFSILAPTIPDTELNEAFSQRGNSLD